MTKAAHLSIVGASESALAEPEQTVREHRYSVLLKGHIRRERTTNRVPIKIRNLSTGGMMGESAYPPRRDEMVEIEMPGLGIVAGRIRWGAAGRIGIEFDGRVDPTTAWVKPPPPVMLIDLPPADPRRPGVLSAY